MVIILMFLLNLLLEKHVEENGIYDIFSVYVIYFILNCAAYTCDYGVILEIAHLIYISTLKDDAFLIG